MIYVIGSGLSGIATAIALVKRGCRPTILDVGLTPDSEVLSLKARLGSVEPEAWTAEDVQRVKRTGPAYQSGIPKKLSSGLAVDAATCAPVFAAFTHPLVRRNFGVINSRLDPERNAVRWGEVPEDHLRRMRESQGLIGIRHLDRVDQDALRRIEHAAAYHDGLDGLDGVIAPQRRDDLSNVYTYFPIHMAGREALLRYSQKRRRDFAAQHLRNCAELPMFAEFRRDCPNARRAARELILLPTYPRYPDSEIKENIEVIRGFVRESFNGAAKETTGGVPRT